MRHNLSWYRISILLCVLHTACSTHLKPLSIPQQVKYIEQQLNQGTQNHDKISLQKSERAWWQWIQGQSQPAVEAWHQITKQCPKKFQTPTPSQDQSPIRFACDWSYLGLIRSSLDQLKLTQVRHYIQFLKKTPFTWMMILADLWIHQIPIPHKPFKNQLKSVLKPFYVLQNEWKYPHQDHHKTHCRLIDKKHSQIKYRMEVLKDHTLWYCTLPTPPVNDFKKLWVYVSSPLNTAYKVYRTALTYEQFISTPMVVPSPWFTHIEKHTSRVHALSDLPLLNESTPSKMKRHFSLYVIQMSKKSPLLSWHPEPVNASILQISIKDSFAYAKGLLEYFQAHLDLIWPNHQASPDEYAHQVLISPVHKIKDVSTFQLPMWPKGSKYWLYWFFWLQQQADFSDRYKQEYGSYALQQSPESPLQKLLTIQLFINQEQLEEAQQVLQSTTSKTSLPMRWQHFKLNLRQGKLIQPQVVQQLLTQNISVCHILKEIHEYNLRLIGKVWPNPVLQISQMIRCHMIEDALVYLQTIQAQLSTQDVQQLLALIKHHNEVYQLDNLTSLIKHIELNLLLTQPKITHQELLKKLAILPDWHPILKSKKTPLDQRMRSTSSTQYWGGKALSHTLNQSLKYKPSSYDLQWIWASADYLLSIGYQVSQIIPHLLKADFLSPQARTWLKSYPHWSSLHALQLNMAKVYKAWKKTRWQSKISQPITSIFEEHLMLYDPYLDQGMRWVREVIHINNKRGIEEFGEIKLPTQATLLQLYSIKRDGTYLDPILIAEKESYSLQDLQVGDLVLAHYLEPFETERRSGGSLTPRLFLRDPYRSVWHRRYAVFIPHHKDFTHTWHWQYLNCTPPSPKQWHTQAGFEWKYHPRTTSTGQIELFDIRTSLLLKPEPYSPNPSYDLPSIRGGFKSSLSAELETFYTDFIPLLQRSKTFDEWVTQLQQATQRKFPHTSLAQQMPHIIHSAWSWVIESQDLLESTPIMHMPMSRKGHRALLLSAILSSLKQDHQIYLARTKLATPTAPFSLIDDFPYTLIRWNQKWIDVNLPSAPLGVIHPNLWGGEMIQIWNFKSSNSKETHVHDDLAQFKMMTEHDQYAKIKPIKWPDIPKESHHVWITMGVDHQAPPEILDQKLVYATVKHRLAGAEGALLYQKLTRATHLQQQTWVAHQWSRWVANASVENLKISQDQSYALLLEYKVFIRTKIPFQFKVLTQSWQQRYASLPNRKLLLYVDPILQNVQITLENLSIQKTANESLSWVATVPYVHPYDKQLKHLLHSSFLRKTSNQHAHFQWQMNAGILSTSDYQSFKTFTQSVQQAEQITIQLLE